MSEPLVCYVRFSDCAEVMLAATVDLLAAVEASDPVLLTDEVVESARALREMFERGDADE